MPASLKRAARRGKQGQDLQPRNIVGRIPTASTNAV
jgi:hypothetical protein